MKNMYTKKKKQEHNMRSEDEEGRLYMERWSRGGIIYIERGGKKWIVSKLLLPAVFGSDLHWPFPWAWIYLVSNASSRGVHGPLCNPTLEQQGALPIFRSKVL